MLSPRGLRARRASPGAGVRGWHYFVSWAPDHSGLAQAESDGSLGAIISDCGSFAVVVSPTGTVLRSFGTPSVVALDLPEGYPFTNKLPREMARERLEWVARATSTGESAQYMEFLGGVRHRTTIRAIDPPFGSGRVVLTYCPASASTACPRSKGGIIAALQHDLGTLGCLTAREAETLALMGAGFTVPEIARAICRSIRTVQSHRLALGRKLDARTQPRVVSIAIAAGLVGMTSADIQAVFGRPRLQTTRPGLP